MTHTQGKNDLEAGRRSSNNPREWVVRSAPTAAFLLHRGAALLRLQPRDPRNPSWFDFVFFIDDQLERAVAEVETGEAEDLLRFSEAQTALFRRINDAKDALGGGR